MYAYRIGCAGWPVPTANKSEFPAEGTNLQRYAARFSATEINSSFHRPHRPATYERWAASVPPDFRFSVKIPKTVTHERRLVDTATILDAFLAESSGLGAKLECLLVQLPPKLAYDAAVAERFFGDLRSRYGGAVALEPRHASWFTGDVDERLRAHRIARVAADPARVPEAAEPAGWADLVYIRLHGSPDMYYSSYDEAYLDRLAERLREAATRARSVWCIFDNTGRGAAAPNALSLLDRLT
jgi:uncharacterized protein YecE (DUF72 family)